MAKFCVLVPAFPAAAHMPLAVTVDSLQVEGRAGCSWGCQGSLWLGSSALVPTVGKALCGCCQGHPSSQGAALQGGDGSRLQEDAVIANITQQFSIRTAGQTLGTFGISHSAYQVKIAG